MYYQLTNVTHHLLKKTSKNCNLVNRVKAEIYYPVLPEYFCHVHFSQSFSPHSILNFYKSALPTGQKVIALFEENCQIDQEKKFLNHLKRYVKNLPWTDLQRVFSVMTGSDIISVDKIRISYSSLIGISRRPIFCTCDPVLELPSTYSCYNELSEKFQNTFSNPKGAFLFDIL